MTTPTTCSQCVHWIERKQDTKGICHAMPPNALGFPLTHPDDWCGQAKAKDQQPSMSWPSKPSEPRTPIGRDRPEGLGGRRR